MFRCSDHDPVLVGLRLDSVHTTTPDEVVPEMSINFRDFVPYIHNAEGGAYMLYLPSGHKITPRPITILSNEEPITGLQQGLYIVNVYGQGTCLQTKIMVK